MAGDQGVLWGLLIFFGLVGCVLYWMFKHWVYTLFGFAVYASYSAGGWPLAFSSSVFALSFWVVLTLIRGVVNQLSSLEGRVSTALNEREGQLVKVFESRSKEVGQGFRTLSGRIEELELRLSLIE